MPTLLAAPTPPPYQHQCPLVGTWHLNRVELRMRDGRASPLLYRGVTGQLQYFRDGHMSFELSEGDWRKAWRGTYSSFLDPFSSANDLVLHRIDTASDPSLVGTEEERRVHLRGDTMAWMGAAVWIEGDRWVPRLVWERTSS